jgi:hypothetical protein
MWADNNHMHPLSAHNRYLHMGMQMRLLTAFAYPLYIIYIVYI